MGGVSNAGLAMHDCGDAEGQSPPELRFAAEVLL